MGGDRAMTSTAQSIQRPVWVVIISVLIGMVLIAGIIALVTHYFFYMILLFTVLMAVAGGMFGWLWADRFGFAATWRAGFVGAVCGLIIYGLYRYFEYWLFQNSLDGVITLSFWDYTTSTARQGLTFSRRAGASGIEVGETVVWIYWAVEVVLVIGLAGWAARKMDI
jgi:hypothetical protein